MVLKRSVLTLAGFVVVILFFSFVSANNVELLSSSNISLANYTTIQECADVVSAGQTCLVYEGVYDERVTTANDNVIYEAQGEVTVNGFLVNHNSVIIQNFIINGTNIAEWGYGIKVGCDITDIQIINNTILDCADNTGGIYVQKCNSPQVSANNVLISGNVIDNYNAMLNEFNPQLNMLTIFGSNHIVEENIFNYSLGFDALRIYGNNQTIRNNTFRNIRNVPYNSGHSDVIQLVGAENDASKNIIFEYNRVYDSAQIFIMLDNYSLDSSNWTFRNNLFVNMTHSINIGIPYVNLYNNIFYECGYEDNIPHPLVISNNYNGTEKYNNLAAAHNINVKNNLFIKSGSDSTNVLRGWYQLNGDIQNFDADYNLVAGEDFSAKTFNETNGVNGSDPLFVNESNYNFSLQEGSPAIDAGVDVGLPYNGTAPDIGAYEYPSLTNASCSSTLNTCTTGTLEDREDSSTEYLWNCSGSNGGTNASCSLAKGSGDSPGGGGSGSGGGGGGGGSGDWTFTHNANETEVSGNGYSKALRAKERIKLNVGEETHYVGLISLNETIATVNVSSDPQQKVLSVGEEWKVEVTGDDYYDISVILVSIENDKANVSVKSIYELINGEDLEGGGEMGDETNDGGFTGVVDNVREFNFDLEDWRLWAWVGGGVLVLGGIGFGSYLIFRRRRPTPI